RKDDVPAVVKNPPLPVEPVKPADPVKPLDPARGGPADPVKPPPADPAKPAELKERAEELKAALEAKKWDEAAKALEALRKLNADAAELKSAEEAIAEGRKKEEADRLEAARKAEL